MDLEIHLGGKVLSAFLALERLFASMDTFMLAQLDNLSEAFSTNVAVVRFFAGTCARLHYVRCAARECCGALCTFIWFFARMNPIVGLQSLTLRETPVAYVAFVRFFPGAGPIMDIPCSCGPKPFATRWTFVGPLVVVLSFMHLQGRRLRKFFLANFADIGFSPMCTCLCIVSVP